MSTLLSLSVTGIKAIGPVILVGLILTSACALGLRRTQRTTGARRWAARVALLLVPTLVAALLLGMLVNRAGRFLPTVRDVVTILQADKPAATTVLPLTSQERLDAVDPSAWKATFTDTGSGNLVTQWTGPVSGITLEVRVTVPAGYRPDDQHRYGVIEALHGYVGDPTSMLSSMDQSHALQATIDAGQIPPSILVIPSLNVDGSEHDCADLAGRPAVGTWVAEEVPRMIKASFPNVTQDREGWLLMGVSAGAYCSAWLALTHPTTWAAAGALSTDDRPSGQGGLSASGDEVATANTLSTMVGNYAAKADNPPLRLYALGAQDDPYLAAVAAWRMEAAAQVEGSPVTVTSDTPPSGSHGWPLWISRYGTVLRWWGSDGAPFTATGTQGPTAAAAATTTGPDITTTPQDERSGPISSGPRKPGPLGPTSPLPLGLAALAALAAAALVLGRSPRWAGAGGGIARAVCLAGAAVVLVLAGWLGVNAYLGYATTWSDLLAQAWLM